MQRRGLTVLVGAVVVTVLSLGALGAPVPYVVLDPGPTVDTLGERDGVEIITVDGAPTYPSQGQLRLTTVGVRPDINLLDAIQAWLDPELAVVPEEMIYPPGRSREEVEQQNQEQFTLSQSTAEIAALRHLGYKQRVVVASVLENSPAAGRLQVGDVLTSVNGVAVESTSQLQQLVTASPAGTTLSVGFRRDGEEGTVEITTAPDAQDGRTPRLGVAVRLEMDVPFDLKIELDRIGGPSAGLMFALGIVDKLSPEDLTGGRIIAGTGTISEDGRVGPIGGLPQKLVAAREAGAVAFLVPAANCAEALRNPPPDMVLIKVETLADALDGLAALREGRQPATC